MKKLASDIVGYVAASAELTSRLQSAAQAVEIEKKAAKEKIVPALQLLLDTGCVLEHSKAAARRLLDSHVTTLDLVANMANKIAELTADVKKAQAAPSVRELGHPDLSVRQGSSASGQPEPGLSNYIGRRFVREKSAADNAFLSIVNPPKN